MTQPRIGFIGVGILGAPIVGRLLAAGVAVTAYDVRAEALSGAVESGAAAAENPAAVASVSDITMVCVRTDDDCVQAVTGPGGILESAAPGHLIVLLATVHPDTATSLARIAARSHIELVDVPLAGTGPEGVREGSMLALAGGPDAVIGRLEPVLATFCQRVVRTGPVGSGAVVKLAHNVMIYVSYLAAVEAAGLARVGGARSGVIADVMRSTGALSRQADIFLDIHDRRRLIADAGAPDAEVDYFQGASHLLEKDLGHAIELARRAGLELPGSALTREMGAEIYQVSVE